jgi:hypothetical protein
MMELQNRLLLGLNWVLRPTGLLLISKKWKTAHTYEQANLCQHFTFAGRKYTHFVHSHNCGWPPVDATERTVELALADTWLSSKEPNSVIEVGAVTPYYWPERISSIADPVDSHPCVTDRSPLESLSISCLNVLCISTLEHIGTGDYGLMPNSRLLSECLLKLATESASALITIPAGYNQALDQIIFGDQLPPAFKVGFLVRDVANHTWQQVNDPKCARLPYGENGASAVVVIEKGSVILQ